MLISYHLSATLLRHISGLEAQLEAVRNQLEAALRERDELEKQVGNKVSFAVRISPSGNLLTNPSLRRSPTCL
jgi:hypothetical protein